jgi:hypothetical protein
VNKLLTPDEVIDRSIPTRDETPSR